MAVGIAFEQEVARGASKTQHIDGGTHQRLGIGLATLGVDRARERVQTEERSLADERLLVEGDGGRVALILLLDEDELILALSVADVECVVAIVVGLGHEHHVALDELHGHIVENVGGGTIEALHATRETERTSHLVVEDDIAFEEVNGDGIGLVGVELEDGVVLQQRLSNLHLVVALLIGHAVIDDVATLELDEDIGEGHTLAIGDMA